MKVTKEEKQKVKKKMKKVFQTKDKRTVNGNFGHFYKAL
jgi:hypothetical protein